MTCTDSPDYMPSQPANRRRGDMMVSDAKAAPARCWTHPPRPIPSAITATTGGIGRMTHPSEIDLDTPTPAMIRRAGEYNPGGGRSWQPSPVRARAMRAHILARDLHTCQMCGYHHESGYRLELDHVVPYKRGGYFIASNLQVLCDSCNARKCAKWGEE